MSKHSFSSHKFSFNEELEIKGEIWVRNGSRSFVWGNEQAPWEGDGADQKEILEKEKAEILAYKR